MGATITLEQIITFLLETPMFRDLDPNELSEIVHIMQVLRLRPGQTFFREGDRGDSWYVLYDGSAEVLKDSGLDNRTIATLGSRACFGEMAILDGSTRSATVVATEDSTVFRFHKDAFDALLANDNLAAYKLVYQMAKVLAHRQRDTTSQLAEMLRERVEPAPLDRLEPLVERSAVTE
jgi:CRP-like cAMP-binding protein